MSREAMQLALEALELYQSKSSVQMFDDTVKALRQALETEQEPVAWMYVNKDGECEQIEYGPVLDDPGVTPLYTAPQKHDYVIDCPKREWQELTDEEIQDLSYLSQKTDASNAAWFDRWGFARAIQQALKEKNR